MLFLFISFVPIVDRALIYIFLIYKIINVSCLRTVHSLTVIINKVR